MIAIQHAAFESSKYLYIYIIWYLFRRVLGNIGNCECQTRRRGLSRIGFRHMQGSLSGDCSGQTVPLPKWEAFEHTAVLEVWQRGQRQWYVKTLQIYRSHMVPVKTQWRWQDLSRFDELDQPDLAKSFRGDLFTGRGGTLDLCRVSKDICTWRDIDGKEIVAEDFSLMTQLVWWDGHDTAHCVCI